jgi:hypothetical protein
MGPGRAGSGGVRERALGSPTHPLAHRGAWRRKTGRGGSAPPLVASKCQMTNVHVHSAQCTAAPCSLLLAPSLLNEMVAVRNKPRCKERRPSPERLRPKPKQGAAEMDAQSAKQGAAELLACFFLGPVPVRKEEDALQSARD